MNDNDELDDAQLDALRAALGDASYLDPASETDPDSMPDAMPEEVWGRLLGALDTEAASRAATDHENVIGLPVRATAPPRSRAMRWAGGLVAASVAAVAVGLAVGTLGSRTDDTAVVAGSAPITAASSTDSRTNEGSDAPALGGIPEALTADTMATATLAPAARMVMSSKTNYLHGQLPAQVVSLVKNAGFTTPEEAMAKVVPPPSMPVKSGFTASWEALRACITWLTQSTDSQALVVDRATYAGSEAGVIVAPAIVADADPSTPRPTVTLDTKYGQFDVWVVNPECKAIEDTLDDFPLYQWQP